MQQLPTASESEVFQHTSLASLPTRAMWCLLGLLVVTVGSLALAWLWPDMTMLHFLWVAQAVPVFYFLLIWWGTSTPQHEDHAA